MTDFCKKCKSQLEGHGRYCVRCGADNGEATKKECPVCGSYYESDALYCSEAGCNIKKYESLKDEYIKGSKGTDCVMFIVLIAWLAILFFSAQFDFSYFYLYFFFSTGALISVAIIWIVGIIRRRIIFWKKIEKLSKNPDL